MSKEATGKSDKLQDLLRIPFLAKGKYWWQHANLDLQNDVEKSGNADLLEGQPEGTAAKVRLSDYSITSLQIGTQILLRNTKGLKGLYEFSRKANRSQYVAVYNDICREIKKEHASS